MPELKMYRGFISHAWTYNASYYNLEKMLKTAQNFNWYNYSVPEHDPLLDPNSKQPDVKLLQALNRQIQPTNHVLILAGMYVSHRPWIQKEIEIAQEMNKPIIGVEPRGSERVPQEVRDIAKVMVGWNTSSIVNAIRMWAL